mmetsp:Transcript_28929/g.81476  ORF Transcript_28929/g.81476 Transcript_28929/m.81476 type:complete len:213 (+) Transcript_28929:1745-2383(+)
MQVLRDLRGLSTACLPNDDEDLVLLHSRQDLLSVGEHGQSRPLGLDPVKLRPGNGSPLRLLAVGDAHLLVDVDVACKVLVLDEVDLVLKHKLVGLPTVEPLVFGPILLGSLGNLALLPPLLLLPRRAVILLRLLVALHGNGKAPVLVGLAGLIISVREAVLVGGAELVKLLLPLQGQLIHLALVLQICLLLGCHLLALEEELLVLQGVPQLI